MTLYKQLVAGMITVFLILMASVFVIEFNTTRSNLEQQQRSEINNTINTVGLALAPYLEDKDHVAVESVINALFDGSSYAVVRLIFLDNEEEIVRSYPIKPIDVPEWFTELNLFQRIHDRRVVTSGWMQLAEVEIVSHPGEAYVQLWQAFIRLVLAFSSVFLIGIVAIAIIVKRALTPLQMIVRKMDQVAHNQFGDPLPLPQTRDLLSVVNGINKMSAQVEQSFKAQAHEAEILREKAYIDPVSHLGNRAYFINQLNAWLAESGTGGIAILEARFITHLYDSKGYEAGDGKVRELADHLKLSLNQPGIVIARISTAEFGVIMPNIASNELKLTAESIVSYVQDLNADPTGTAKAELALGVVHSEQRKSASEILTLLDNALSAAKANPELTYGLISSDAMRAVMGKQQWKTLVEEAIHNAWFQFRFQVASYSNGQVFHREVYTSIEKDGEEYRANQYLIALEQLNASHLLDQYVVKAMVEKIERGELDGPVAINIAHSSILLPNFIRWVAQLLSKHPEVCPNLHFELPESSFVEAPHHTALLCNAIKQSGALFGVDNYGRHFQSLDYINEFRPNYVKLDYLFTHHLEDEKQKFTLTSVARTAHNLGITTVASRVETQTQLDFLSEHFVEVFQGFIVDK
ncbi:bifunctional diguanylate cyclase/phosphodiesterase [Vibrio sp.]|uniref:bifunctional diguanylate cyclase/phosphodiesterase n=1 Tax=Vibrio sp. TaxID=678 RepID=UPI003D09A787